ncbi:(S)-coclaurine N-methyltransferase-like isoform X3 [Wolffia australiana]
MESLMKKPYEATVRAMVASLERNLLPDLVVRRLTRILLASRLRAEYRPSAELQLSDLLGFVDELKRMPIAVETEKPKAQHYEVPTSFFKLVLGKNLKYSCCYYPENSCTLDDAEDRMLEIYCTRAQVKDGQSILDVGCGWGSLSLFIAKKFKNCKVTGICNSATQKAHIEERCRELQLSNVNIIVADISKFEMEAAFDRVISIEMFEHMKNYKLLLKKLSSWMKEDALLFVHYFCHKNVTYHFEDINEDDWITRYFFTGGTMPSANLLLYFQDDVAVVNHWLVNGKHYAQTSEDWLKKMDENATVIRPIMESTYGRDEATKWTVYWRTFFIAVAELFGYNNGEEWMVAHFLFKKKFSKYRISSLMASTLRDR